MNKYVTIGAGSILSLSSLMLSGTASAALIDDFSVTQGGSCSPNAVPPANSLCVDPPAGAETASSFVNGSMITGQRDILLESTDLEPNSETSSLIVNQGGTSNTLLWNNSTNASSKVIIQYDGIDDAGGTPNETTYDASAPWDVLTNDGIGDDYTFGGVSSGISFDVLQNDLDFSFELLLTDTAGETAFFTRNSLGNVGFIPILFSDPGFALSAPTFDFTDVDSFQISLISTQNGALDLEVNFISGVVPEPSSIALLASGLLGAGFMTRRKKKATA